MRWFDADKDGLRQVNERLVERRGFGMIGGELYQNVMDTDAGTCVFQIDKVPNKPRIRISVIDDGPGFSNLRDAWTLFAPSEKKGDPTKAGRFNLGEKMVLSFAHKARIHTTSGTVEFNDDGRHEYPRRKRGSGTEFYAELACTSERYDQLIEYMSRIIVKPTLQLFVNGEEFENRDLMTGWEETLSTEIGDDLRKTKRKTQIQIYEPFDGEVPMLYELGIPVVETGDKWHVNVMQKVPLNVDRDNVTPAYLRAVRVSVVNNMHRHLDEEDTTATWVNEAADDSDCSDDAAETFRVKKYGEKSVASDPMNPEADAVAQSKGFTIIPSRGLSTGQRNNLKRAGTLRSSSAQFPTAGKGAYSDDPNAPPVEIVPDAKLTDWHKKIREYARGLGERLMDKHIAVRFVKCTRGPSGPWSAAYGGGQLDFNLKYLNRDWFARGVVIETDRLLIHEFAHEYEEFHTKDEYHRACCRLGAKLKEAALADPRWFRRFIIKTD
jgi:hypothetical protein